MVQAGFTVLVINNGTSRVGEVPEKKVIWCQPISGQDRRRCFQFA